MMIEESKSAVTHSEMGSPREFQSDVSATPKGMFGGINLQTPKGNITGAGGFANAPISSTNASKKGFNLMDTNDDGRRMSGAQVP